MNKRNSLLALLIGFLLFLPGCEVIGGIFKAGFITAIILVVLVIALIVWGITQIGGD